MSVAEDFAAYRKVVGEHIEKLERENAALRELLREARDTVRASTVEDGISGLRREYRCGLYQRIKDTLEKEAQL